MISVCGNGKGLCESWCVRVAKARKKRSEVACLLLESSHLPGVLQYALASCVDVPCFAASEGQHCHQPSTSQTTWPTGTRMPCTSVRAVSPVSVGQRPRKCRTRKPPTCTRGRENPHQARVVQIRTPFLRSAVDNGYAGQTLKDNTTRS